MRPVLIALLAVITASAETGIQPRPNAVDYPAHQTTKDGTIAATLLPSDQVARIFSSDVSKRYVVVEVGVYPEAGHTMDLLVLDFALKTGDDRAYPVTGGEVAWHGKRPPNPNTSTNSAGPHVVTEAGIGYGTRTNPATGRTEHGLSTWAGAGVDNRPAPPSPSGTASTDRTYELEGKLQSLELPEGPITRSVAGYLYFPMPQKKAKNTALDLEYSRSGERIILYLPITAR